MLRALREEERVAAEARRKSSSRWPAAPLLIGSVTYDDGGDGDDELGMSTTCCKIFEATCPFKDSHISPQPPIYPRALEAAAVPRRAGSTS